MSNPDTIANELALVQVVLRGYPESMAQADALRACRVIGKALGVGRNANDWIAIVADTIGFGFEPGELQAVNASDLERLAKALRFQAAPTEAAAMAATVPADSVALCASDLRNSVRYDHIDEYIPVMRAIADRLDALASQAPVAGQPAEPSPADPKNPHWDYLARYWQMGYEGTSLVACTGDAPIKAWYEGKAARDAGKRKLRPGEPAPPPGPQAAWCDFCGGCYEWGGNGLWHHAGCRKIPAGHGTAWLESAPKGDSNG